jgi:hypothetical protein
MGLSTAADEVAFQEWCQAEASKGAFGWGHRTRNEYYATPSYKRWEAGSEQDLIKAAIAGLSPMFEVLPERWGTMKDIDDSTHKVRVDLICVPRPGFDWPLGTFAVEVKEPTRGSNRDLGDHLKQAFDYRMTLWDGFGRLPVLLCPGFQGSTSEDVYYKARRVCGSLGLGELFVERHTNLVSLYMTADPLIRDSQLTAVGARRRKAGLGVASNHVK